MSIALHDKANGVSMSDDDDDVGIDVAAPDPETGKSPRPDKVLIAIAEEADLYHDEDGVPFADVRVGRHRETHAVRSSSFRRHLTQRYYRETRQAPRSEAMSQALGVIEAKAHFEGDQRKIFVRVGREGDCIYIDMCDDAWRAVEISPAGWRVVDEPPVRFRRSKGMQELPIPSRGGSVDLLRPYLNVSTEGDFILVIGWLLAALHAPGPYPVLAILGEQGAAKSTTATLLRNLVDPNTAGLRSLPREERDFFVAAGNTYLSCFDNVSGLPHWLSDALCKLATGGGYAARTLFTDQDETIISAMRPAILNGIEEFISRADLADRAIPITLEAIPEARRKTEVEIKRAFEADRPKILGALFEALAHGLGAIEGVKLERLPRMADFAKLIVACEPALFAAGTFMSAYDLNRAAAVDTVIEADSVADAIRRLMATRSDWSGTASELLSDLTPLVEVVVARGKTWPQSPRALSGRIRRAATFLRRAGVSITHGHEGHSWKRMIYISTMAAEGCKQPSAQSAQSAIAENGHAMPTIADGTPPVDSMSYRQPSAENWRNSANADDADDADDQYRPNDPREAA
jgi:hypothetical protein